MQSHLEVELAVDWNTEADRIVEKLKYYGVCVVNNVLNEEECNNIVTGMIDTLSYATSQMPIPFNVNDSNTWRTLDELQPTRNMIYQHWGFGQAQFCWDVRCNPKCIDVFSRLYSTDDLLVSFDGFSFIPPAEYKRNGNNYETKQSDKWYHFDQSTNRPDFECVQGWVNGFDTNYGDATLAVMVGSHAIHQEYGQVYKAEDNKDWIKVDDLQFFIDRGCVEHRIVAPRGSLVLWNSKTLHYGAKPLNERQTPNFRAVIYLCYTPSSFISESTRRRKIEIFKKRGTKGYKRITNHWPNKPVMFPEIPYIRSGIIPNVLPLDDPVIPEEYLHLIGYPKRP